MFPNIQPELPLAHLKAITSYPAKRCDIPLPTERGVNGITPEPLFPLGSVGKGVHQLISPLQSCA